MTTIRTVTINDAEAITGIYNHYVKNTTVTFEEEPVSIPEMQERILNFSSSYPYLVYEENGCIKGYAYVSRWRTRSAFRYSAELSIYLDHHSIGNGIGNRLFSALLDKVRNENNIHSLISLISLPNDVSVYLHEKAGFKQVALYKEVGYKFDKWLDLGGWELIINR